MKKSICMAALLVLAAAPLPAAGFSMIGGGVGYASQQLSTGDRFDVVNVALQWTSLSGQPLGWYVTASIGTAVSAQSNGVSLALADYSMNYGIDAIMGLGFRIPSSRLWTAVVGGGLYYGLAMLIPNDWQSASFSSFSVGAGIGGCVAWWLTANLYLGANAAVAYGFYDPLALGDYGSNGLRAFGGVGAGIVY
jgi:hypothetical protein